MRHIKLTSAILTASMVAPAIPVYAENAAPLTINEDNTIVTANDTEWTPEASADIEDVDLDIDGVVSGHEDVILAGDWCFDSDDIGTPHEIVLKNAHLEGGDADYYELDKDEYHFANSNGAKIVKRQASLTIPGDGHYKRPYKEGDTSVTMFTLGLTNIAKGDTTVELSQDFRLDEDSVGIKRLEDGSLIADVQIIGANADKYELDTSALYDIEVEIVKASRPEVPDVTYDEATQTIGEVTPEMEYSTDQVSWRTCTNSTIDASTPGTYYVRYRETPNYKASGTKKLTIHGSESTDQYLISYVLNGTEVRTAYTEDGIALEPTFTITVAGSDVPLEQSDIDGWYTDFDYQDKFTFGTEINEDMTLYAKTYDQTVTFIADTAMSRFTQTQEVFRGQAAKQPDDPEVQGYTFTGWYADQDFQTEYDFGKVMQDTTVYGKLVNDETGETETYNPAVAQTHQVTYRLTGESGQASRTYRAADKVQPPEGLFKTSNQEVIPLDAFDGWYTDEDCTEPYTFGQTTDTDLVLYAKMRRITLYFDYCDGSEPSTRTIPYGTHTNPMPERQRDGLTFNGWYKDQEYSEEADFEEAFTDSKTFYAKYIDANGNVIDPSEKLENHVSLTVTDGIYKPMTGEQGGGVVSCNIGSGRTYKLYYKPQGEDDGAYTETKPVNAGSYTAKLFVDETDDYKAAEATADFVIRPRPIMFAEENETPSGCYYKLRAGVDSSDGLTTKVYDGTTDAKIVPNMTVMRGDDVTVEAEGHFVTADAGENKEVVITSIKLSGAQKDNYILDTENVHVTATIKKAQREHAPVLVDYKNASGSNTDGYIVVDGEFDTEYSLDDGSTWTDVPSDNTIRNLGEQRVVIRYKETKNYLAGPKLSIDINNSGTAMNDENATRYNVKLIVINPLADGQQGTSVKEYTVSERDTFIEPEITSITLNGQSVDPEVALDKWYSDAECTAKYTFGGALTDDITLYAKYRTVSVKFDFCDDSSSTKVSFRGTAITPVEAKERDGMTFGGWFTDTELTQPYDETEPVLEDMTVYAKYTDSEGNVDYPGQDNEDPNKENTHTVTYMYNGTIYSSADVKDGNTAENVVVPIRISGTEEYVPSEAIQWYSDEECTQLYDFTLPVTSDLILYEKTKRVNFVKDYRYQITTQEMFAGQIPELDSPTRDGYSFGGWFKEAGFQTPYSPAKVLDNTTIYAKWTNNETGEVDDPTIVRHLVQYYVNGNEAGQQRVENGKTTTPIHVNMTISTTGDAVPQEAFVWYRNEARTEPFDFNRPITSDTNVYGETIKLVMSYDYNYKNSGSASQQVTYGTHVTRPDDPKREGYTFSGWYKDKDFTSPFDFTAVLTENTTVYAKWINDSTGQIDHNDDDQQVQHTVTYVLNGNKIYDTKVDDGDKAEDPDIELTAPNGEAVPAEATKWYSNSACTQLYDFNAPVTGDITIYGKTKRVLFTFIYNDGHTGEQNVYWGVTPDTPIAHEFPGYTFVGWCADQALQEEFNFAPITQNTTIYGKWVNNDTGNVESPQEKPAKTYTMKLYVDGKSAGSRTIQENATTTEPTVQVTSNGQSVPSSSIDGWYTDAACTQKFTFGGQMNSDITLYAKVRTVTVKFDYCDGSYITNTFAKGTKTSTPDVREREGFTFGGWYTDDTFSTAFDFNRVVNESCTVYAKYTDAEGNVDQPDSPDENMVTVTFVCTRNPNTGVEATSTSRSTVQLHKGNKVTKPDDPETDEQHYFTGWQTSDGTPFDFTKAVNENVTLYGYVYLDTEHYVYYDYKCVDMDGALIRNYILPRDSGIGTVGQTANITVPTVSGYTYQRGADQKLVKGGMNHILLVYSKDGEPASETVKVTYHVIHKKNTSGTVRHEARTITAYKDYPLVQPDGPELDEMEVFDGWYVRNDDGTETKFTFGEKPTGNIALYGYANLDKEHYTEYAYACVDADGNTLLGVSVPERYGIGKAGEPAPITIPVINGYTYQSGAERPLRQTEQLDIVTLTYQVDGQQSGGQDPEEEKQDGQVTVSITDFMYGDTPGISIQWTGDYDNDKKTYAYREKNSGEWKSGLPETPGEYEVKVSFPETENFKAVEGICSVTVQKKKVDVKNVIQSKVYDGTTKVNATIKPDIIIGDDEVTVTGDMAYDSPLPGNRNVTIRNAKLTGKDADKYELNSATYTVQSVITPNGSNTPISVDPVDEGTTGVRDNGDGTYTDENGDKYTYGADEKPKTSDDQQVTTDPETHKTVADNGNGTFLDPGDDGVFGTKDDKVYDGKKIKYDVTYHTSRTSASSVSVYEKSKLTAPADPSMNGHEFKGWYKDKSLKTQWNFSSDTITGNTDLYAKFAKSNGTVYSYTSGSNGSGSSGSSSGGGGGSSSGGGGGSSSSRTSSGGPGGTSSAANDYLNAGDGSWKQDGNTWTFVKNDGTKVKNAWVWIDGNNDGTAEYYYFDQNGNMAAGTTTPDGYTVNENGARVENGTVKTRSVCSGSVSGPSSGSSGRISGYRSDDGGTWSEPYAGRWRLSIGGRDVTDEWIYAENPYASAGQERVSWFHFNKDGYMDTGWLDDGGHTFYLNPVSDGTKGRMVTGWQWIDGYCYYFKEISDGTKGMMYKNGTTPDGYTVDEKGRWTVNGTAVRR